MSKILPKPLSQQPLSRQPLSKQPLSKQYLSEHGIQAESQTARSVMIFAPWCYGHHPTYLKHLIQFWQAQKLPGTLNIVVVPEFLDAHSEIINLVAQPCGAISQPDSQIQFVTTTPDEQNQLESIASNAKRSLLQHQLIEHYARTLKATHGLILYFDSCQLPLVLGRRLPCAFSGIYFRPTLHYSQFMDYRPNWREKAQQLKEDFFLSRVLKHPQFKTLLCLDPLAVPYLNQHHATEQVVYLPDPVDWVSPDADRLNELRSELNLDPNRKVLLAFGRLVEPRKGTEQLLQSLLLLGSELSQQVCLLLVGEPEPAGQALLEQWLAPLRQSLPMQIITQYGYVPEPDLPCYFQLADLVLTPYQNHIGMSGLLLLASAAGKPVLSSDFGLMAEMVKRHGLGLTVDSTHPDRIAAGLRQFLQADVPIADRTQMQAFAAQHSVQQYASTVFQQI